MALLHTALVNTTEDHADRFYKDLLGLEKKAPKPVPADLLRQLFKLNTEATIINYVGENGLFFEIFIADVNEHTSLSHVCLTVKNRDVFLEKCGKMNVPVRRFAKEDGGSIVFIADYDKNLFEIKEKPEIKEVCHAGC